MRCSVAGHDVYAYTGARPIAAGQPTVLFVHGAGNDHSVWTLQSRYFAHHGWNALAPDLPGHGRSAGSAFESVESIADWVLSALDTLGIERTALVGHSLGALATLECAARHPDRVTKLALLGPASPMTVADALLDAARRNDHVAYELIAGWSYSAGKQLGGNASPGVWLLGNALRLLERTAPGVLHADLKACQAYAGAVRAAARIRRPALVVLGARDLMAPPKSAAGIMDALAGARRITLRDCGHAMMAEQPDEVLDALRAFLQGS